MIVTIDDFSAQHTFECGQCFRWQRLDDGSYLGVAGGRATRICTDGNTVNIDCSEEDYNQFWKSYLDAERDYAKIKRVLSVNDIMTEAISFGSGIRILRQEFHEALISFIISQRSSIPRIKTCVSRLCENFGKPIDFHGQTLYAFPTVETLANVSESDFAKLGVGYRAQYLVDASRRLAECEIDFDFLNSLDTQKARDELLKIRGVGDKVCDCVLLFSLGKFDLFPSDVWIKRVMKEQFNELDAKNAGESFFGEYSGFAQQYLFYWRKFFEG